MEALRGNEENWLREDVTAQGTWGGVGSAPLCSSARGRQGLAPSIPRPPPRCEQSLTHRDEGLEGTVEDKVPHHLSCGDVWHKPDEEVGDDGERGGEDDPLREQSVSLVGTDLPSSPCFHTPCGVQVSDLGAPELPQG